ncbi:hypothetical protein EalM132_00174 [Exiguobacterium phage vB_EalM-132]|nr:hypothetical protein EalM132_00004 [Exiguobacterium phage vB_EalM-132]AYP68686.1 hypothetical protein EalM132_00174 [Exiguobacterium phage vB_EalM-132]
MNSKNDIWTIVWYEEDKHDIMLADTAHSLQEVAEVLVSLQQAKVDPLLISVFPPNSNDTYMDLLNKALVEKVIEDSLNNPKK